MKIRLRFYVLTFAVLSLTISCAASGPPFKTVTWEYGLPIPDGNVTVTVPESWEIVDLSGGPGILLAVTNKPGDGEPRTQSFPGEGPDGTGQPIGPMSGLTSLPRATISRTPRWTEDLWDVWAALVVDNSDHYQEVKRWDGTLSGGPAVFEDLVRVWSYGAERSLSAYMERGDYTWAVTCVGSEGNGLHRDICDRAGRSFMFVPDSEDNYPKLWKSDQPLSVEEYILRCGELDAKLLRISNRDQLPAMVFASLELLEPPPTGLSEYHEAVAAYYLSGRNRERNPYSYRCGRTCKQRGSNSIAK